MGWDGGGGCCTCDLEDESEVVGVLLRVPRRFSAGHLYYAAANAPDVTASPVLLPPQHLWCHERNGPQQLALKFTGTRALRGQSSGCPKISNAQPMSSAVNQ